MLRPALVARVTRHRRASAGTIGAERSSDGFGSRPSRNERGTAIIKADRLAIIPGKGGSQFAVNQTVTHFESVDSVCHQAILKSKNVEFDDSFGRQLLRRAVSMERQGASRDVTDAQGKKWRIREMEMAEGEGTVVRKSLIALNDMVIRRFWVFPPGWRELSEPALLAFIEGPAQPHPAARSDMV
jgi:hypothetical protein